MPRSDKTKDDYIAYIKANFKPKEPPERSDLLKGHLLYYTIYLEEASQNPEEKVSYSSLANTLIQDFSHLELDLN